jgi:hypothetical protein
MDKDKYEKKEGQTKQKMILFSSRVNGQREVWEEGRTNKKENDIIFIKGEWTEGSMGGRKDKQKRKLYYFHQG